MKNFMGKDGFQWFVGVVENRADPKTLGRVKVRCLGYHTANLNKLKTSDLPWAHVMNPITSATVSGIGQSPLGMVEGTWVIGFFIDGPDAQSPCIIGTLPGIPSKLPTKGSNIGFQDYINAAYPREINKTDVNRLAVNETTSVPDTDAIDGGNQVVEFVGGEPNADQESLPGTVEYIAKSNRNSTNDTIKMAQFQADLSYQLNKKGFNTTSSISDITTAANTIKKDYSKIYKLPPNILNTSENIIAGASNHIDTIISKTASVVSGSTSVGTLLKDSILVNADGFLYTPGNLKDILPADLSVDALATGISTITSFNIKNLSIAALDNYASTLTSKIPGNLITGEVKAGALKYFKSPLKKISINPHLSNVIDAASLTKSIGSAQIDGIVSTLSGASGLATGFTDLGSITGDLDIGLTGGAWSEPPSPYAAVYPYNHVYESECGHIREYDDTVGAERIHERHKSGSSYEIGPDGTKVTRVKQDNYEIISNDDYLHVQGTRRQTVDEGIRIRCNANSTPGNSYNIEVGFGSNVNIEVNGGNINLTTLGAGIGGDININAARNINMQAAGSMNIGIIGKITETSAAKTQTTGIHQQNAALHDINGNRIDLN